MTRPALRMRLITLVIFRREFKGKKVEMVLHVREIMSRGREKGNRSQKWDK